METAGAGANVLPDAPLVILDEPAAALDATAEHELFARIGELFADRSVLPISHRFSTVRSADRICVRNEGSVVGPGARGAAGRRGGLRRAFHPASIPYQQRLPGTCASREPAALCSRPAGWTGSAA